MKSRPASSAIRKLALKCAAADLNLAEANAAFTEIYVFSAMELCGGNVSAAAKLGKTTRATIIRNRPRRSRR